MKFTHSGEICFGCRPQGEDEIYFYVSDTGIGIPAGEQDKIFDRFTKLDHEVPGTGLGLTLSQTIVQNLGGRNGSRIGSDKRIYLLVYPSFEILSRFMKNKRLYPVEYRINFRIQPLSFR